MGQQQHILRTKGNFKKMEILKRSGLLIPKQYSNTQSYVKIKEELERRTQVYNKSAYTINIFYLESDNFLLIPRNFPIEKYIINPLIHDHRCLGDPIKLDHSIKPRGDVQEKAINYLMNNENGILQLLPGVGKTIISIFMIAERKLKTLILVHRDSLVTQWKEKFLEFTNLNDNDISRLSSNTFENDLDKSIIISTTQTFLSLLKRKRKEFLIKLNDANIGIFIADEVHTSVGAPTFSECSVHIPAKYTYGLSATPYRFDGNEDIIKYHLGEIFSDDDVTGTMDAKVTVFLLDYEIDIPKRTRYIYWGGDFQRSRYLNMMRKSKPFTEALKHLLVHLKDQRETICMLERINLINELYNWLPSNSKSKFCGNENADTLKYKITFATPGKCRDGVDAPWKDCVIMTSPISNIEQLTGRVIRYKSDKNKPSVIDMVDYGCKRIAKTFYKRREFYLNKNWEIQYFIIKNRIYKKIDEDVAFKIINGE